MLDLALESMIQQQLVSRGISDQRVIRAFWRIDRKIFVPDYLHHRAFTDVLLPIGLGQTISPPHVVAWMLQALALPEGARVLEIGTGSGYQTALLSELAGEVFTVETLPELSARARKTLVDDMGLGAIAFRVCDGFQGWSDHAPFDGIVVTASAEEVPWPLVGQLRAGARVVMPIDATDGQQLRVFECDADGEPSELDLGPPPATKFTPLVGEALE